MITLDCGGAAITPSTSQVEIVCGFAADVSK
jgi:hypothetical protein